MLKERGNVLFVHARSHQKPCWAGPARISNNVNTSKPDTLRAYDIKRCQMSSETMS